MNKYEHWPFKESAAQKYEDDPHFRVLVDTMTSLLWNGEYTGSEIREAAIFAMMKVEAIRIRPLLFDPNDYTIENLVLGSRSGLGSE